MPTLFTEANELRRWRSSLPTDSSLAFVPTMGALHAGHERLIQEAMSMASTVIVSIFVNPLQFNDPKDLVQYPRTLSADIEICRRLGVDAIFAPTEDEVYPPDQIQVVSAGTLGSLYEGQHRPGHFDGVLTVVDRLYAGGAKPRHLRRKGLSTTHSNFANGRHSSSIDTYCARTNCA